MKVTQERVGGAVRRIRPVRIARSYLGAGLPTDFVLTPALILTTWASGVAAVAAALAWWRTVGRGFLWLAAGVVVLLGIAAALTGDRTEAWVAVGAGALAVPLAERQRVSGVAFAGAAAILGLVAAADVGLVLAVTGAVALGGVSDELLLGHWYLVDPRLPRRPLVRLAWAGIVGLVLDAVVLITLGALAADDRLFSWVFAISAASSVLLMVAASLALRQPSYPGVMAATGLSYLALLTALAATTLGRVAIGGG